MTDDFLPFSRRLISHCKVKLIKLQSGTKVATTEELRRLWGGEPADQTVTKSKDLIGVSTLCVVNKGRFWHTQSLSWSNASLQFIIQLERMGDHQFDY